MAKTLLEKMELPNGFTLDEGGVDTFVLYYKRKFVARFSPKADAKEIRKAADKHLQKLVGETD